MIFGFDDCCADNDTEIKTKNIKTANVNNLILAIYF